MKTFNVGDRVGYNKVSRHEDPEVGTVTEVNEDGFVLVKWDGEWMNKHHSGYKINPDSLEMEVSLNLMQSALEAEYDKVAKEVRKHLDAAADDINKAVEAAGGDFASYSDETGSVMDAFHNAGWNTSSLSC